jgi:hypothetical protein
MCGEFCTLPALLLKIIFNLRFFVTAFGLPRSFGGPPNHVQQPGTRGRALEEIRLLGESISFSDAPDLTSEQKFARAVVQFPVPSRETIFPD